LTASAWDAETLNLLDGTKEVRIETMRPDGSIRRTIIWIVVDDGEVLVRSWKGDRGHWYQAALDAPDAVNLSVGKARFPVRAVLADDEATIERCSRALEAKYRGDPATTSMILPYNLATTLRLEPR
jgi:hypothetical protein